MAKSKYTPQRIKKILQAISESGKDKDGIAAGGISKETFYKWAGERSDFADQVAHAKALYAAKAYRTDPELHLKAVLGLRKLVDGFEETHSSVSEVEVPVYDKEGKQIGYRPVQRIRKAGKWRRPPNRKALEFLLAHRPELEESLPESVDFDFDVIPPDDNGNSNEG